MSILNHFSRRNTSFLSLSHFTISTGDKCLTIRFDIPDDQWHLHNVLLSCFLLFLSSLSLFQLSHPSYEWDELDGCAEKGIILLFNSFHNCIKLLISSIFNSKISLALAQLTLFLSRCARTLLFYCFDGLLTRNRELHWTVMGKMC
jgi:hypothetical protein